MLASRSAALSRAATGASVRGGAVRQLALLQAQRNATYQPFTFTKYRITKPLTEDSTFDDALVAEPSREELKRFTKETPLFLRFLKIVCDQEKRPAAFIDFAKRCESGLVVEKDVYVTKSELLESMWTNGYTDQECNAYSLAFPDQYRFHYPELAVLFDLPEDSCYKFAMRRRLEGSDLVELNNKPGPPLVSSYMFWYAAIAGSLAYLTPFSSYYMLGKTVPMVMVGTTMWKAFGKKFELAVSSTVLQHIEEADKHKRTGQEIVFNTMKDFAHDSKCIEHLGHFKEEVQAKLSNYRRALALQQKADLQDRVAKQLAAVAQSEAAMASNLQEVIVKEAVAGFRSQFDADQKTKDAAFSSAVAMLAGNQKGADPLTAYFNNSLKEVAAAKLDSATGHVPGSVTERVAHVFIQKEKDFLASFTVKADEVSKVKGLAKLARTGDGYDFSKLNTEQSAELESLYKSINTRVGFATADESAFKSLETHDAQAKQYTEFVNQQLALTVAKLRNARLSAFARAFE